MVVVMGMRTNFVPASRLINVTVFSNDETVAYVTPTYTKHMLRVMVLHDYDTTQVEH